MALVSAFSDAWNRHDAKALANAFADHATLSGASGRLAAGRGAIEKLFEEEQSASMKATTFTWTVKTIRFLTPNSAMVDGESEISGMTGADGKRVPTTRFRISTVLARKENAWAIEPFMFVPLPAPPLVAEPPAVIPAKN